TIDKLFSEKVGEVKVTELPKVDVIEVEKEAKEERKDEEKKIVTKRKKTTQKKKTKIKKKEKKEREVVTPTEDVKELREDREEVSFNQTPKIEEMSISEKPEFKKKEKGEPLKMQSEVEIKDISGELKTKKEIGFFDIADKSLKKIPSEPEEKKEEKKIPVERHLLKRRKISRKPLQEEEKVKPLVDLSMKNILSRGLIYDQEVETKEEEKSQEEPAKKEEKTEEIPAEDFTDYVFLDETEPAPAEAAASIGIEKLDYGDVELPRESLRFEPMVEFKPREEELEINVPISNERFEEIAFYPVNRPFAYVKILKDKQSVEKIYAVLEPELTKREQEYLEFIKETLESIPKVDLLYIEERGASKYIEDLVNQVISDYDLHLSEETKKKILYLIKRDTIGYGKIDALMRDPYIEDISCDGAKIPVFIYHRDYGSMRTNVGFENEEELSNFVIKLAQKCGKHISIAEPMLDATLPDGSRIQATLGTEVTTRGSTFTIRKFRAIPYSPIDLVKMNTLSPEMLVYLWMAVEHGASGIFAGGTASGKTTTLNAVALFIPREAKIVSIEETREINLPHPNWIPGVTRSGFGEVVADKVVGEIDMYDLLKAALRQRPEYIIVGEIRGREAYVLFQAMATGHTTYSTMHADSPQSLIHRLEGKPINVPRVMIQSLDFVCFQATTRVKDKRVRRITQIIEIVDIDPVTKEIITNEVFSWDSITDTFRYSGRSYLLEKIRVKLQISKEELMKELNNRIKIINWMIKNNMTSFRDVAYIINEYRDNPDELLKRVEANG
ncbi:MAG: hypothetical protein DRN25_05635, partial [Thermoplasmata archaeon]